MQLHPADAKDLEMLARVLIPAYMAQQFTAVCIVEDPSFLEETASGGRHVYFYAKHVRDEVSISLTPEEVESVLRAAADTARVVTQRELKILDTGTLTSEAERLRDWCDRSAKPFAREVIAAHFAKHDDIDRILGQAKRD